MGQVFDRLTQLETLRQAFDRVEENQGCAGVDGVEIQDFALDLEGNSPRVRPCAE